MSSRAGHVTTETVFGQTLALRRGDGDEHNRHLPKQRTTEDESGSKSKEEKDGNVSLDYI